MFNQEILFSLQSKYWKLLNSVNALNSNVSVRLLSEQFKFSSKAKASIPVKSEILNPSTSRATTVSIADVNTLSFKGVPSPSPLFSK